MPSEGLASASFAEFARQERHGRVEPKLGPRTALLTADPTAMSAAAEISSMVSEFNTEPRLFDAVPREAQLTSAPSRGIPVERLHVGGAFYLLLVGLIAAVIIGAFFGVAFFLLAQPKNQTFVAARPAIPAVEQAVTTAQNTTAPGDAAATITAAEQTAPTPASASGLPGLPAPPPQVSSSPAAAEFSGRPGEPIHSASGGRPSHAHLAAHRYRSGHHPQSVRKELAAQADKQRILSAAMDRAHRENFSDPFQSLTPPQAGQRSPFDQLIAHLTGQKRPTPSLTPPHAEQP
jgi:hypothetical protein